MSGLVAVILIFIVWALMTSDPVTAADVNRACAPHEGVVQYVPTTFEAMDGVGTAVCKDGVAVRVK